MSNLDDANIYSDFVSFARKDRKLSLRDIRNRKARFIDCLIRFTDIFAQTALFVNSADFENHHIRGFRTEEGCFRWIEDAVLAGMPIWRFLVLSPYQSRIFEQGFFVRREEEWDLYASEHPCLGCIWFKMEQTPFGTLEKCDKDRIFDIWKRRDRGGFDHRDLKGKECKYRATLDKDPDLEDMEVEEGDIPFHGYKSGRFQKTLEEYRERYKEKQALRRGSDGWVIPAALPEELIVDIEGREKPKDDTLVIKELARAFNNKKSFKEMEQELREAMRIEAMFRFLQCFIAIEEGTGYVPDVAKIAKHVYRSSRMDKAGSRDEVYKELEEAVIEGKITAKSFIKPDPLYINAR